MTTRADELPSMILCAFIVSAYVPHPYSWRNGCDQAWRNVVRTLGVAATYGVPRYETRAN